MVTVNDGSLKMEITGAVKNGQPGVKATTTTTQPPSTATATTSSTTATAKQETTTTSGPAVRHAAVGRSGAAHPEQEPACALVGTHLPRPDRDLFRLPRHMTRPGPFTKPVHSPR